MKASVQTSWFPAAPLDELERLGARTVQVQDQSLVLFLYGGHVYAVDNRCPHMGFPLHRGTLQDGILTCHWHHARFDLKSGGTFDQWADDLTVFSTQVRDQTVWVELSNRKDPQAHYLKRLGVGLERDLSLVIAKSVISLLDQGIDPAVPFRRGLEFGVRYRGEGWGQGLTILTCMINLIPHLAEVDRRRALYHGLSAVTADTTGMAPRFALEPLPEAPKEIETLKKWFRQFVEVRDSDGAERCILTALEAGAEHRQMADMLFAAATDHRYISTGHPLDFTNKAFEALDLVGWELAAPVLTSLVNGYANASRMEESNAWRHPVDLVDILEEAFADLPAAYRGDQTPELSLDTPELLKILHGDDPQHIVDSLMDGLRGGRSPVHLAGLVAHAAALRIARFHTSNEFSDWDTALHTFTFANAVHQGLLRSPQPQGSDAYPPLLRGVFDAAMSVYLDRFLNIPAARMPTARKNGQNPAKVIGALDELLNHQHQVEAAAEIVVSLAESDGGLDRLLPALGHLLLREDRDFHTIQMIEAALRQYQSSADPAKALDYLVAAARYLAAHTPTMRAQEQRYQIAHRLSRGERLFEEEGP